MNCSIERIRHDIESIAKFSKGDGRGCTRPSYSPEDQAARSYIIHAAKQLGMDIRTDGAGNLRATYPGTGNGPLQKLCAPGPSVMIGSHMDTVPNGGKFDGVLGVVCALETIRYLHENRIPIKSPVELIIFAEEEGTNFGVTLIGSKSLAGKICPDYLKELKNDQGIPAYEIIKSAGYDIGHMADHILSRDEVKAMLELHIEQGGVLDKEHIPLGIVMAIVGMRTYKITLEGISNHAGSTPMFLRRDPMVGAAEIILKLYQTARKTDELSKVATVGKLHASPNAANVIAGQVEFYVDIRDVRKDGIESLSKELFSITREVAEKYELSWNIELAGQSDVVHLSENLIRTIREAADASGMQYKLMNSGAVHDSVIMSGITDTGMIFVPSINGLSHCPEEDTKMEDIGVGCDLLIDTVIRLINQ